MASWAQLLEQQVRQFFIRLGDGGSSRCLGVCELLLDALEFFLTLMDAGAALLEDCLDRTEGKFLQDKDNQEKVDDLCGEKRVI